jgi:HSP20 family protein
MSTKLARRQPLSLTRGGDVFDVFRKEMNQMLGGMWTPFADEWPSANVPQADLSETDQALEVRMDLPGMKPEELDIQLDKNVLTVRGERSEEAEETDKKYHRLERHTGSFYRSISLPQSVNADEVAAEYKDGVLTVHLPKSEDAKSQKIVVKS